ncbi:spinster family MFS transporter [Sphingosinicella rhizophila]|uniref:MFS transporter n=1 Tax=Sphingosinicella rhizophila TaxID=3050082 RepID=A0ABU3QC99_9SPHN|nr:MFS transporter [Sphingosinicella sp. GR2756]MDT9601020.1 MFS transporter [Sphingosinicella sp. GR2756]
MSEAGAAAAQSESAGVEAETGLIPPWQLYSDRQRWTFLTILFLICTSNYIDRQLMSVLIEPIKNEFGASDTQMGLLSGLAFAVFYAVLGIPIARIADRGDRKLVVTVSLALWSAATAICGLAQNFWQMFAARVLVGVGEAGAIPPAQSLIADYFAPEKRTRALAIFMSSATVGYLVAFMGGAQIAARYGWRTAFLIMGIPGLLIALIAFLGLKEPRKLPGRQPHEASQESLTASLRILFRKPSYVLITTATVFYFLVAYGAFIWFPPYMQRVLGVDLAQLGAVFGAVSAVGTVAGTLLGGWISDKMAARGIRWMALTPAIALAICCPLSIAALAVDNFTAFLILFSLAGLPLSASVPAMFGLIHIVCGSRRRAMAVAINFFFANLIGLGFGPVITGYLSDMFTAQHGAVGLRYALMIALLALLPAALAYWRAARHLEQDMES